MSILRIRLIAPLAAAGLLAVPAGGALGLPIQADPPDHAGGPPESVPASDTGSDQGLGLGGQPPASGPSAPDAAVAPSSSSVLDGNDGANGASSPAGPPDPFPASSGTPVGVQQLEDGFMLSISHPRGDELGFLDPFVSLRIRPGSGPDTVTFLAKPPATIPEPSTLALLGAALLGLASRRWVRRSG